MKNLIHKLLFTRRFMGRTYTSQPFLGRLMPYLLWVLFLTSGSVQAQTPTVTWQKLLGGNATEEGRTTITTTDGGYIMAGFTGSSNSGDVGVNHGGNDYWVVKLNVLGVIQWQKLLGGTGNELITAIQQTTDGGYILCGYTNSTNSGDVGANHGGAYDYWILKLDALGNTQWQKLLGGSGEDRAMSIIQTTEGGYIVEGYSTSSNSGDVAGTSHGNSDIWILKLDVSGNILWQKLLGGNLEELASGIKQTADGGYIVSGQTRSSNSGDVGTNNGSADSWVVKLDTLGAIQWQKTLGGSADDGSPTIEQTADGGYLLGLNTLSSNSGDVGLSHGGVDAWFVKLNASGTIVWQKTIGGSNADIVYSFQKMADGGFVTAGYTASLNSGDIGLTKGGFDAWMMKLNAFGVIEWQKTLGGTGNDYLYTVQQTTDGGFIYSGYIESSNSGDIGANHGNADAWLVKLTAATPLVFDATKCYSIVNKVTGKILEVKNASLSDSAQIYQGTFNNNPHQLWQIVKLADGKYNIISKSSGKAMDVLDNTAAGFCVEGTTIRQFPIDGTSSQKWRLELQTDGYFKIINETCNKFLRVESGSTADGANVAIKNDFGAEYFKWLFQETPCAAPIVPNQCYRIVNKATGKALEIKDGLQNDGTQIYQWAISPNSPPQLWKAELLSDGKYTIRSFSTNKVMDVLDNTAAGFCVEGTIIQIFPFDGTNSQRWSLLPQTDGSYKILNATCNKYLRVESASMADGANVGIKNDFGSDAFKWYFQSANCTTAGVLASTNATFGFEARASEGRAKLQWVTNTGYKTDYFEIERLNAQGNFEVLGKKNTEGGNDMTSYTFTDNDPLDGDNFYRINSISNSNIPPQYSEVKKVTFSKNDGISIFPNPADEFINVDLRKYEGKTVALSVYNSVGLLVKKQTIEKVSAAPQQIDVQGFGTGSYLLRVQSEGKREVTRLFHIAK